MSAGLALPRVVPSFVSDASVTERVALVASAMFSSPHPSSRNLNGSAQAYLAYAYNPLVSYLFAWTYITALIPGGKGVIALIFAEYMNRLLWHATSGDSSPDSIPDWSIKLTACLAIAAVTVLCIATRNLGTRAAVVLTTIKVSHSFVL